MTLLEASIWSSQEPLSAFHEGVDSSKLADKGIEVAEVTTSGWATRRILGQPLTADSDTVALTSS